ncbi:MAG: hypothetical protein AB7P20_19855 [Rhizobiaceae bacterium]
MSSFKLGEVYAYHYLWPYQQLAGEESGRKARPSALIFRSSADAARLYLFPITTRRPDASRAAVEIPGKERLAAGLDQQCWLILDEFNITLETRTYDFLSLDPLGSFSETFTRALAARIAVEIRGGRSKPVRRS